MEIENEVQYKILWKKTLNFSFNTLIFGNLFYLEKKLLLGTTDGKVRIFSNEKVCNL